MKNGSGEQSLVMIMPVCHELKLVDNDEMKSYLN